MADQTFKNVINGELVDSVSGETYDIVDPTTGAVYAQAPMSGPEDIDRAYAAAEAAFPVWSELTPKDRGNALLKIAQAIEGWESVVQAASQRSLQVLDFCSLQGALEEISNALFICARVERGQVGRA